MTESTLAELSPGAANANAQARSGWRFLPLLALLFVGSGCAALIYENVWYMLLGLQIGVSAISLGVLLGTFMGGMCIGSLLFPRYVSRNIHPLKVYAMLEAAIGVIGLMELALVPRAADLYVHLATATSAAVYLRAIFAGVCLLPPTILMGATLPAIARWVESSPKGVSWLGFFYGTNIIGAVIGCLWSGFYLLPQFNMAIASIAAAWFNAGVSILALLLASFSGRYRNAGARALGMTVTSILAGIAGLVGLIYAVARLLPSHNAVVDDAGKEVPSLMQIMLMWCATKPWAVGFCLLAALAVGAILIAQGEPEEEEAPDRAAATPSHSPPSLTPANSIPTWTIYLSIALSGLTGLGAEVIWTRLLSLMLGATVYTFSNILAIFLLGLGIGSSVGSVIVRASKDSDDGVGGSARNALGWCQFLLALAVAWASYSMSNWLPFWPIHVLGAYNMVPHDPFPTNPIYKFQIDLAMVCWTVLPGAVLWGASFPLALGALAQKGQDTSRLVGRVYAANTVGAILGSLFFSMWAIPALGSQGAQKVLLVLSVLSGIIAFFPKLVQAENDRSGGKPGARLGALPLAGGLLVVVIAEFGLMQLVSPPNWVAVAFGRDSASWMEECAPGVFSDHERHLLDVYVEATASKGVWNIQRDRDGHITYEMNSSLEPAEKSSIDAWAKHNEADLLEGRDKLDSLLARKAISNDGQGDRNCLFVGEGMNVSVAVTYENGTRYFHGAGKVQASSAEQDMRLQRMLGHISALTNAVRPGHTPKAPEDVLVVACGAGVTAGSFVPYGSNITIVDIEPMVPKYVTPQFWLENHNVIPHNQDWPYGHEGGYDKTKIVIDDGRHFIKTTPKKFDVITSDPIDPWVKGCAALNTVEYYQMCKEHLKPGGVVALWIPLYESSEATAKSVICTFFKVFPNGIIWSNDEQQRGYDCVLYAQLDENGGTDKLPHIDLDAMQKFINEHPYVKKSLDTSSDGNNGQLLFSKGQAADGTLVPGAGEAVELFSTYAGAAPYMNAWTHSPGETFGGTMIDVDDLINWDSNLRLQYVAGMWINVKPGTETRIFQKILAEYQFPKEMFSGSEDRMRDLKRFLDGSGRHNSLEAKDTTNPLP